MTEKSKAPTIREYDLDAAEEERQPAAGWHTAVTVDAAIAVNKAGTGFNVVLTCDLTDDDPDVPGKRYMHFLPLPSDEIADDYLAWVKAGRPKPEAWSSDNFTKDGRHKYAFAMARIKKLSTTFGGPESGKIDLTKLGRNKGKKLKISLEPEKDRVTGDPTGRMIIAFDGIAPA